MDDLLASIDAKKMELDALRPVSAATLRQWADGAAADEFVADPGRICAGCGAAGG